jgi:hypothetical protein
MRYRAKQSRKPARRFRGSFATGVTLILVGLLAFAAPALALETHPFTGVSVGPDGTTAGHFSSLQAVAVDPSNGNLYVLDTGGQGGGRLYKFDSSGEPLNFTATGTNFIEGTGGLQESINNQVAVAPPGALGGTAGDIYVANCSVVKIYSPAGAQIGELKGDAEVGRPAGVAIDEAGRVFVGYEAFQFADPFRKARIREYIPTANPVTDADLSGQSVAPLPEFGNVAIDGKGHIYGSSRNGSEGAEKLENLAATTAQQVDPSASTLAIEPTTNDLYAGRGSEIRQYDETGSLLTKFGENQLVSTHGVGVGGAGGDIYAAVKPSGRLDVFGPMTVLPNAIAGTASGITRTTAVLHGTINADGGPEATCEFEFTTQGAFETSGFQAATTVACTPLGPFTGDATEGVTAKLAGLAPGGTYRYRLVGSNENGSLASDENGSAPGQTPSFETLPAFTVVTGTATDVTSTSMTLSGSINPEGVPLSACFFEYGETAAYGSTAACEAPDAGEVGTGSQPVPVHADIEHLAPNKKYHFRLVGESGEFGGVSAAGGDTTEETVGPPRIISQEFSAIGQTAATISGVINPDGEPTAYLVEYVTDAAFNENGYATATKVPAGGMGIGSGRSGVAVSQSLTELVPATKYHFRLSATNSSGNANGPDQVFVTQGMGPVFGPCPENEPFRVGWSALLPDCRAYEQASSPDKNGDSVAGVYPLLFAAEDGSGVSYYSAAGALPPAERGGTQNYATYLASRDGAAGSWSSQRLLPPQEFGEKAELLGTTSDLRFAIVEAGPLGESGLFEIDTEDGAVIPIVPYQKTQSGAVFGFDGAAAGGSQVFFESSLAIPTSPTEPSPAPGHDNLYRWDRASGLVTLVGVLPTADGGGAPPAGSFGGSFEWYEFENLSHGGALNIGTNEFEPLAVAEAHAISPSGDQVYFTSAGTGQLYLRRGLEGSNPTTVHVSTPNAGVISSFGEQPAAFQEATPDGSRAFFMSRQKLTADATTGSEENGMDLYRWDSSAPTTEALTDIVPDPGDPNGAEVQGLLGVSASGSSGYFIARGVLAAGAKRGDENLYRFSEKAAGGFRITFIATLANASGQGPDRRNVSPKVSFAFPYGKTSRVSEDGKTLLFASRESLTGYDNVNTEGLDCEGGVCPELYVFSAKTEKVTCVSCDPTGAPPVGAASLQSQFFNAYFTTTEPPAVSLSRNLSADGTRVFFQTPDPLVAADENGKVACAAFGGEPGKHNAAGPGRCQDVYEWEAVGSGSCKAIEVNGGCLYLLSTGQSEQASYFVGASREGSNAFIATDSQLVPSDRDRAADVYDVRVNGGLASQYATSPPSCGSAEACKAPVATPALPASPATPSFQGPGNRKPKQCKKGFVRQHGKCVKKPEHRTKKRSHGKKHSGGAK